MNGGLFINLYDKKTLALYIKYGIYGFLMKPIFSEQPSSRSRHYQALADYACSRKGTHVFFFANRTIVYGGTVKGSESFASFYLNGRTSPFGREANSTLFWDESNIYNSLETEGVFRVNDQEKAQPYILQFDKINGLSYKMIPSDDLYFELGKYSFPLPSNSIQGMSFCTLTPGETNIALELMKNSSISFEDNYNEEQSIGENQTLFEPSLLDYQNYINEAHMEFTLLADLEPIRHLFEEDEYILCRQVPISPFKPSNMDRADVCLYSISNPIKEGTIPNIIIELKRNKANFKAYNQVARYLKWLKRILSDEEFSQITPIIIAPDFVRIKRDKVDLQFEDKIIMYANSEGTFHLINQED